MHFTAAVGVSHDVQYVVLLACLLVVPRVLQRFRVPPAITAFALGAVAGPGAGLFVGDPVVSLFSTLGIVAVFLLAGLEVDFAALGADSRPLMQHLAIRCVLIAFATAGAVQAFGIDVQAAAIVALALLTPSGGFILDALPSMGLYRDEQTTVRNKVIATELLALAILLVALQSTEWTRLAVSVGAIGAMVAIVPLVLRSIASVVVPHAPKSEFAFLVLVAVVCALATRELGVYYLVGAFVVGMTARRFREQLPAMSSDRIVHAVESLSSLFAPFYFFHAGAALRRDDFSVAALGLGVVLLVVVGAVRVWSMVEQARWTTREGAIAALRTAVPMLPTLVFTLVLAEILRERFAVPPYLIGALAVYATLNTALPGLILRVLEMPEEETPIPPWPQDLP